jgi:Domain of unknown function (DUF1929)
MKPFARLLPRYAVFLLVAATLRCSDGGPVDPIDGGTIEPVSGDGQDATVGTTLPESLIVRVLDQNGEPLSGVTVEWEAQGGGSVSAASTESGADGRTGIIRTLGMTPGEQATVATAEGLDGSPITFTATATESPAGPVVEVVTQPPASALDGEVFAAAEQPVVRVLTDGVPVEGATVTASLGSGSGTLEGELTAATDAEGIARFGDLGIAGEGDHTIEFTAPAASATSNPITLSALSAEATTGEWGPEVAWDIVPLHMNLMPNGKVLAWGKTDVGADTMGMPRLWDPALGSPEGLPMIQVDTMLFCAGHVLMPDGRLMVAGGHLQDDRGIATTYLFDQNGTPERVADMAHGRWYPTLTVLPDGRLVTVAGQDGASNVVTIPEIWENGAWVELPGADNVELPYYPRNFIDPTNGLVFMAGERIQSLWLDVDGFTGPDRGQWINGPAHTSAYPFNRDYGSAVMYESGEILYVGGGGYTDWDTPDATSPNPTATAEKIDLKDNSPSWSSAGSMSSPRRHHTATVLPHGQVLVTGGVSGGGFNAEGTGVHAAEIWNPATNDWTVLASSAVTRAYHGVSILMPDGTVLHGASGDANIPGTSTPYPARRSHEIFRPPYLFMGARPEIAGAPASVGYGQSFDLTTAAAGQITAVRLIRLGSVTHAFDMGTMAISLDFTRGNGTVSVTAPASSRIAPPGYYQIFVLNRNGVPSEGRIVRVQ